MPEMSGTAREMTREELYSEYVKRGQEIAKLNRMLEDSYSKDDLKTIFEARVKFCRGKLKAAETYRDKIVWASNLDGEQSIMETLIGEQSPHTDDTFLSWYEENIRPLFEKDAVFIQTSDKDVIVLEDHEPIIKRIQHLEPDKQYVLFVNKDISDSQLQSIVDLLNEARDKNSFVVARMGDIEVKEKESEMESPNVNPCPHCGKPRDSDRINCWNCNKDYDQKSTYKLVEELKKHKGVKEWDHKKVWSKKDVVVLIIPKKAMVQNEESDDTTKWTSIKFIHPLIISSGYTGNESFRHMDVTIRCYGYDDGEHKFDSLELREVSAISMHDQGVCVSDALKRHAGRFGKMLGEVISAADDDNLMKLRMMWPNIWDEYLKWGIQDSNKD